MMLHSWLWLSIMIASVTAFDWKRLPEGELTGAIPYSEDDALRSLTLIGWFIDCANGKCWSSCSAYKIVGHLRSLRMPPFYIHQSGSDFLRQYHPQRCDRHCLLQALCPGQPPREMLPELLGAAYRIQCGKDPMADIDDDDGDDENTIAAKKRAAGGRGRKLLEDRLSQRM